MALMKMNNRIREVYNFLEDDGIKYVVLSGEPGVGKTWTAREVSRVARKKGLFDIILWVYLSIKYDNDSLLDSIARQLSLLPTPGEHAVEKEIKGADLHRQVLHKCINKRLLLVLDDEGNQMNKQQIMPLFESILELRYYKVLITRNYPVHMVIGPFRNFTVKPLSWRESVFLLGKWVGSDDIVKDIANFVGDFAKATLGNCYKILLMAKAIRYFWFKGGVALLIHILVETFGCAVLSLTNFLDNGYDLIPYDILIDCQKDIIMEKPFFIGSRCINKNELIAYWLMEGYLGHVHTLEKAYNKGYKILTELIDFQVLKNVETDCVMINPLKWGLGESLWYKESAFYRRGYYGNARLGLDSVFANVEWKGIVRMAYDKGAMRTFQGGKLGQEASALLLHGNSLGKGFPSKFISTLKKLQVLAIFDPTEEVFSLFTDKIISELHVFVVRSCSSVEKIDRIYQIAEFENLTILEISGPTESSESWSSSLYNFPDTFFKGIPKLQSLNLSSLAITLMPESLYDLEELKWLILRDCTSLKTLNSLRRCKSLVVLDCSGSTSLEEMQDRSFMNLELQFINLSNTKMKILPLIGNLRKLTHLLLSNTSINRLRNFNVVTSLEVIDLSNSSGFNEFHDQSLESLVNLKILDLSGTGLFDILSLSKPQHLCLNNCTQIKGKKAPDCLGKVKTLERFVLSNAGIESLPLMSHLTNLRQLSVTSCSALEEFPDLSSLENMEELDFSWCKEIKSIPDNSFEKMSRLKKLILSGTSIESLPSISKLRNLQYLILIDCLELEWLPEIESKSLEKLEELNLGGCKALRYIDAHFFDGMFNIRNLNLSEAPLHKLPSCYRLINLREFHLRNCKGLKSVPDLEALTSLEILDLSGSSVSDLPLLSNLSKLRQLILKNCSELSLFREAGTLNILQASVQYLPYGISELPYLERLDLPIMDDFRGADSEETEYLEGKPDACEWGISDLSDLKENRPSICVSGTQFLQLLEQDQSFWNSRLNEFHLSVRPSEDLHFHEDDFKFKDIYIQNKHFNVPEEHRLVEVNGFQDHPKGIDEVLRHANQLYFLEDKFQTWPLLLSASLSNQIKGYWIEKCGETEIIFQEDEMDKMNVLNSLKILWVSNAVSLKCIFGEIPQHEIFQNLEQLYFDCCPELSSLLALSNLPQKLKILHVKFCDELSSVFELTSADAKLQSLETLHLWEVPELESIGCELPSLKTLYISNCPKLQKLEETIELAGSLENLSISNVSDLQSLTCSKDLTYLSIDSCPNLTLVKSSSEPPNNIEKLRITCCDKLETLFEKGDFSEIKMEKLKMLHLQGLPKLKSFGATLPNQANCCIVDCLKLQL